MLLLPIKGDIVQAVAGIDRTVLAYSAYKDLPAVYVDGADESMPLADILKINGTAVQFTKDQVFSASSLIQRKINLPQVDDKVVIDNDAKQVIKVKKLKLFERGNLASGVQIFGVDVDTGYPAQARLIMVLDIIRADGNTNFPRAKFKSTYKDYLGSV